MNGVVDLSKYAATRWFSKTEAAGWNLDKESSNVAIARVWIYSIEISGCVVAQAQLSVLGVQQLAKLKQTQVEYKKIQLKKLIQHVPTALRNLKTANTHQERSVAFSLLAEYLALTITYASIPEEAFQKSVHLFVINWERDNGEIMIRPLAMISRHGPLNPSTVAEVRDRLVSTERKKNPERFD